MANRYQKGNQKPHFEEGQTTQWPKGTKKIIRSRNSKDRQHNGQKKKGQTTASAINSRFHSTVHQYIVKYNKRVIFSSQLFLLLDILRTRFCLYSMILYNN